MPSLKVDGAELHYQVLGPESGKPVIMLHGLLLGNSATWYFGAATTLAKTHRVIVYDLRGHGYSSKAQVGYDLATMLLDLESLVDQLGYADQKISLVGHSYGSLIALHYARAHPQLVERLVLVEGPLPPGRGLEIDSFLALSAEEKLNVLPENVRQQIAKGSLQGKRLLERLGFLASETDLIANLKSEADIDDSELQSLDIPVQLIYGDESQLIDVAKRLSLKLPEAELHWLKGGHYLPSQRPRELSQLIGGFIS